MELLLRYAQHLGLRLVHAAGEARTCRTDMAAAADPFADRGGIHFLGRAHGNANGSVRLFGHRTAALPALPPYLLLLGAWLEALPLFYYTALPLSHSLARLEQEGPECACIAAAQAKASDFGALCRKVPGPMGGVYRQKIIFLTN